MKPWRWCFDENEGECDHEDGYANDARCEDDHLDNDEPCRWLPWGPNEGDVAIDDGDDVDGHGGQTLMMITQLTFLLLCSHWRFSHPTWLSPQESYSFSDNWSHIIFIHIPKFGGEHIVFLANMFWAVGRYFLQVIGTLEQKQANRKKPILFFWPNFTFRSLWGSYTAHLAFYLLCWRDLVSSLSMEFEAFGPKRFRNVCPFMFVSVEEFVPQPLASSQMCFHKNERSIAWWWRAYFCCFFPRSDRVLVASLADTWQPGNHNVEQMYEKKDMRGKRVVTWIFLSPNNWPPTCWKTHKLGAFSRSLGSMLPSQLFLTTNCSSIGKHRVPLLLACA